MLSRSYRSDSADTSSTWGTQLGCFSSNTFSYSTSLLQPSVTRWMTSPTPTSKASEQLPSARHVCCPGGSFYRNHQHQVNLKLLNVCLTGSCRRCRFRTVQHCWGRTVTGGRWRGHSLLLWWTPPETAYLRNIDKIKIPITFNVRNKVIGIMYIASKSSSFISSPKGGSVQLVPFSLLFDLISIFPPSQWVSLQLFLV